MVEHKVSNFNPILFSDWCIALELSSAGLRLSAFTLYCNLKKWDSYPAEIVHLAGTNLCHTP